MFGRRNRNITPTRTYTHTHHAHSISTNTRSHLGPIPDCFFPPCDRVCRRRDFHCAVLYQLSAPKSKPSASTAVFTRVFVLAVLSEKSRSFTYCWPSLQTQAHTHTRHKLQNTICVHAVFTMSCNTYMSRQSLRVSADLCCL